MRKRKIKISPLFDCIESGNRESETIANRQVLLFCVSAFPISRFPLFPGQCYASGPELADWTTLDDSADR